MAYLLGLLIGSFLPAFLCYSLAEQKKRNKNTWMIAGFLIGFIGVIILAFLPSLP